MYDGNIHVTSNLRYRGKWQMGYGEWKTYGGLKLTGQRDPARVSEAEQDEVAFALYKARGWEPWTCAGLV